MGCVYCATNTVNGKRYIGLTCRTLEIRMLNHYNDARAGTPHIFHRAIRKYGFSAFVWEILFESNDLEILKKVEIATIRIEKTRDPGGYNMTDGGEGTQGRTFTMSARSKKLISVALRGRQPTPEQIRNMSLAQLGRNKGKTYEEMYGEEKAKELKEKRSVAFKGNNHWKGKKHTAKARQNMSNSQFGVAKHSDEFKEWVGAQRRGKTWEELYGKEKADEMKRIQSERNKNWHKRRKEGG